MSTAGNISELVSDAQRRRVARWGMLRLLRFCWFWALGDEERACRECRLNAQQNDETARINPVYPIIIAFQEMMHAADGLVATLQPMAEEWFAGLSERLSQLPEEQRQERLAWLEWAASRKGRSPLEQLFETVLQRISGVPREAAPRPDRHAGMTEAGLAALQMLKEREAEERRLREGDAERRQRQSGRRALIADLARWLAVHVHRLVPDPHAILAERRRLREAEDAAIAAATRPVYSFHADDTHARFRKA